jgi:drug/metabolite transporter superfamily protein YnfA
MMKMLYYLCLGWLVLSVTYLVWYVIRNDTTYLFISLCLTSLALFIIFVEKKTEKNEELEVNVFLNPL